MRRRIWAGLASFALAGTIVAGTAVSAFAQPLSNSEFKKQGNAICAEGNRQIDAAAEQVFADLSEGPAADSGAAHCIRHRGGPEHQAAGRRRRGARAAQEPQGQGQEAHQTARAAVAKVEADPSLLADEKHNPFAASDKQAKKLGLKECAGGEGS